MGKSKILDRDDNIVYVKCIKVGFSMAEVMIIASAALLVTISLQEQITTTNQVH